MLDMSAAARLRGPRFDVIHPIGGPWQGVSDATRALPRRVAVKVSAVEFTERFAAEGKFAASLNNGKMCPLCEARSLRDFDCLATRRSIQDAPVSSYPSVHGIRKEHSVEIGVATAGLNSPRIAAICRPQDRAVVTHYSSVIRIREEDTVIPARIGRGVQLARPRGAAVYGAKDACTTSHSGAGVGIREKHPANAATLAGLPCPGHSAIRRAEDHALISDHRSGVGIRERNAPQIDGNAARLHHPIPSAIGGVQNPAAVSDHRSGVGIGERNGIEDP